MAIRRILQRWGFVDLSRYGLALTPEGRVRTLRSDVLDDGLGGRIVGWQDTDLAATELSPWVPNLPTRAPKPAQVASERLAAAAAPKTPAAPALPKPEAVIAMTSALRVEDEAGVDEDDWEWTIALARARAAAEESEAPPPKSPILTTLPLPVIAGEPVTSPRPTLRAKTLPPPVPRRAPAEAATRQTRPLPIVALPRELDETGRGSVDTATEWPAATNPAAPLPSVLRSATQVARATVIPVPTLPSIESTHTTGTRLAPVVRPSASSVQPASLNRFPKGTAPITPSPQDARSDEADPMAAAQKAAERAAHAIDEAIHAVGDRTRPGIALPVPARTVALPLRRRTAPRE